MNKWVENYQVMGSLNDPTILTLVLVGPEKRQLSDGQDAAILSWPRGKKPKTEQLHSPAGQAALTGTFWGMLLGVIFLCRSSGWRSAPRSRTRAGTS